MSSYPSDNTTPLLEQYFTLKNESSDAILLFRVGDFYEAYGEDAKSLSQSLEIVLTGRDVRGEKIPMAGVPHHTLDNHLKKLIAKGHKVAISEQLEEAGESKGLIRRDIVRFLTPGTILEPELLQEKEPNYVLSIFPGKDHHGLSWCDVSTGLWFVSEVPASIEALQHELSKISPKEVVLPKNEVADAIVEALQTRSVLRERVKLSEGVPDWDYSNESFDALTADSQRACQLLYGYLKKIYCGDVPRLSHPVFHETERHLVLDFSTRRNLELFQNLATGESTGSLLELIDRTHTAMGGRMLRHWLLHPLLDVAEITKRQEAVIALLSNESTLRQIQKLLGSFGDLERLASRVSFGSANARDVQAIQEILEALPLIKSLVSGLNADLFQQMLEQIPHFAPLCERLKKGLHPHPPLGLKDGGLIREGFHPELDLLKQELKQALDWITHLEEREKSSTGIKYLKVGFNQVFGYYIEISRSNLSLVPAHYIRKQTLSNAERYIIEELKIQEAKILSGQEKCKKIEYELFCSLRNEVREHDQALQLSAAHLATLDVLVSLALVARERNWTRPIVDHQETVRLKAGRHPVVEASGIEAFVPNDVLLEPHENRLLLITGPNMAGKSTYLRQTALIVILAQLGSFVPAESAQVGVVDRIFTRIGASDDLHRGESTFFVEMKETAEILQKATSRSLVLLDEIGRGTSTFDGLSLAWAIAEALLQKKCKVLFATHYHEITALAHSFSAVKNFSVAVKDRGDDVVFLRRIVSGGSDQSYGIHVARLAGIPAFTVERAKQILNELEERDVGKRIKLPGVKQLPLWSSDTQPDVDRTSKNRLFAELKGTDVNRITGLEALNLIARWKEESLSDEKD